MLLLQHAMSFLAISQLLFMGLFYQLLYRKQVLAKLIVLYIVCVIAFVLTRLPEFGQWPPAFIFILSSLANLATSVLWVITHQLFVDRRANRLVLMVIAGHILLRTIGNLLVVKGVTINELENLLYFTGPRIISFMLAVHVVYLAVRGLKTDLVRPRRQLRVPFAVTMGTIIILIVGATFLNLRSQWLTVLFVGILFLLALLFNMAAIRMHKDAPRLLALAPEESGRESRAEDKEMIERLHRMMEQERLYAQHLTVGMLAVRMSVPEHKLRRLINQKLHYRNFNQYLNRYRIEEAARRLQDPTENHLPISTISMDVGYASQSTFNKTFKELKGVTPSQFRTG